MAGGLSSQPSSTRHYGRLDRALPDVADDLSSLAQDYPEVPRVRRLLGDVFMRRECYKKALNAYRSAR